MKKFLLILLIALVASTTVQLETGDLNGIADWIQKIAAFIASLWGKLRDLYNWLKENGYWDQIIDLVKKYGKPAAVNLCASVFGDEGVCSDFIDLLLSFIS